ncbi:glycosyltransferase [Deltaproteobacteria bacterium TL4]
MNIKFRKNRIRKPDISYPNMRLQPGVVIVIYNEEEVLQQNLPRLTSLFEEIVIVDNHSQDNSPHICRSFPVTYYKPPFPLTRGECWNVGAGFIQAAFILFLHSDTLVSPEALQAWQSTWETDHCDYSCFKIHFKETHFKFRMLEAFSNARSRFLRIIYGDQGLCVRKSIFQQLGGFPKVYLLEDLKMSKPLKAFRFRFIPHPISPSSRKFHKLGFIRYLLLMYQVLFLNLCGVDTEKIYQLYYQKPRHLDSDSVLPQ